MPKFTVANGAMAVPLPARVTAVAVVFGDATVGEIQKGRLLQVVDETFVSADVSPKVLTLVSTASPHLRCEVRSKDEIELPPRELLGYLGLDRERERQLDAATVALVISLDAAPGFPSLATWVVLVAAAIAANAERLVFDAAAVRFVPARILAAPLRGIAELSTMDHIILLASSDDLGRYQLTTQGLRKFGLPELAISNVMDCEAAAWLVNATAQALAETVSRRDSFGGQLHLQRRQRVERGHAARAYVVPAPSDPAQISVLLGECHDPEGSLELHPPRFTSREAWMSEARRLFAFVEERLVAADEKEAVTQAMQRACDEIAVARSHVQNDAVGTVFIKRGFATDSGTEYMWLKVRSWQSGRVCGVVENVPRFTKGVRQGDELEVEEADVVDWLIDRPDGTRLGDYTSQALVESGG